MDGGESRLISLTIWRCNEIAILVTGQIACSRLKRVMFSDMKTDANNALGAEEREGTSPFPISCASHFSLTLFSRRPYYPRAWHGLRDKSREKRQ